jgi:membrane protein DedA with SNARE-associated domain
MQELHHLVEFLAPFIRDYGAFSVMIILFFESVGAPLPGESLVVFAAVLAGRGDMSLLALLLAAWIGAVLGDNLGYAIGRRLGRDLVLRYGSKIGLDEPRLRKLEGLFARYGAFTVGAARFFNVLRQLNGIVAGTLAMDWRRFLLANAVGGALWVATWSLAGFYLGQHSTDIARIAHDISFAGAVLAGLGLILIVVFILRRRRPPAAALSEQAHTQGLRDQDDVERQHHRRPRNRGDADRPAVCEFTHKVAPAGEDQERDHG